MHKVKCHPSVQKGGCHEAHDIEDIVKIGQIVKGCAYYAARSMADDAQLIFCPYSYIINPVIRGAMDVDIKGAIIVLDEAHNLEDIAREGGSVDLEEDALHKLQMELHQLKMIKADVYQPLSEMIMNLISWIEQTKSKLEGTNESKHYFSSWTGDKAVRQLQEANISQQFFPVLLECATKAIRAASDTESDVLHLSGMSIITLEEPRGGDQEEFETVLKGYYNSVSRVKKPVLQKRRRLKRTDDNVIESAEVTSPRGAAFLAVFRGKVSEGIDFSDDNARVIELKKKYNNTYRSSKNLLSGNEWYCQQAFRALNQALGRCIRHRYDYGAIILLDWRFQDEKNRAHISKWLRPSIRMYGSFEKSLDELRSFFREVKDLVSKNKQLSSLAKYDTTFPQMKPQSDIAAQTSVQADKDEKTCTECVDLECNSPKDSGCFEASTMTFSNEDQDLLVVKETPVVNAGICVASPGSVTKDANSGSTIIQASINSPDQFLFHPMSSTSPNEVPSVFESTITPGKDADQNTPLNLSVCSYMQKRRKPISSTFINLVDEENSDISAQIPGSTSFEGLTNGDMLRRIDFGFETSSAENGYPKETNVPRPLATGNTIPVMDKRLQIFCLLCRSPLGRPENNLYLSFSLTVSSKVYLLSLFKERLTSCDSNTPPTVPVIVTDISSVDPRLCNGTLEGDREQGTWREEDGCVFKKVFCPFCSNPNNCLGVQIKAADEKNVQLLNKIMLYHGSVVIGHSEAAGDQAAKDKDLLQVNGSSTKKTTILKSIEKFAYSPKQTDLGGWRTTKSKLKLSKK
ncbi:Fanconi anemia group J [Gossypium arboreum]|uniref:Fanconi anemia group J n=1 Tax=Gossypium arboreum TaxID=29729 RepID=A0A0B0PMW9_GOSAR|nr:Fanconi anemia group J [Gossypium arboreum]